MTEFWSLIFKQNPTRKKLHPFDTQAYKERNLIERAFSRRRFSVSGRLSSYKRSSGGMPQEGLTAGYHLRNLVVSTCTRRYHWETEW